MSGRSRKFKTFFTNNPPVPFVHNFGKFSTGKLVQIEGIPCPNPSRFTIYIQHSGDSEPDEIAMCFDVRFQFNADQNVIVRNHKQGGWGTEERQIPFFPFKPDVPFSIIFLFERNCFKIAVDNNHFVEFGHRWFPMDRIDTLRVDGDVQLKHVLVQR